MDASRPFIFIVTVSFMFGMNVSADSKSCKGITKDTNCTWELVFHAPSGNGEDVLKAWTTKHSNCDIISGDCPCSINNGCLPFNAQLEKYRSTTKTLRSPYIDFWSCLDIAKIKFELDTFGETVAFIEFDGRNTDDLNWFHNSRILNTSWTDMLKAGTFNVFSINKENKYGRNFFINRSCGGCDADTGWFSITDVSGTKPCDWERVINETYPQFLYSKNGKVTKWSDKNYGTAHVLNIYIQRGSSSATANADLQ
uniref:Uncharacterized protein LOC111123269 isoform X3 n=1 Tax=Crassostrea virginica TaxID=6565 RepID=A0A8B8CZH7_CRAVI|nr:uncharacterized protein LOC111123269 isoform X3 [Crassostrea virginica]